MIIKSVMKSLENATDNNKDIKKTLGGTESQTTGRTEANTTEITKNNTKVRAKGQTSRRK